VSLDMPNPAGLLFVTGKPHPRVWITNEDLAGIKEKARRHWWAKRALKQVVARAESAADLIFAKVQGERVPDLSCLDERTNTQVIADIAVASALEGRDDLAEAGCRLLSGWQTIGDVFGSHPDLGLTTLVVGGQAPLLALGIDLLWSHLPADETERLEHELLRPAVAHLDTHGYFDSNWQTAHNGGYVAIGLLLEDEELVKRALFDPDHGLMRQLVSGVREDGMWYEGSWGYHRGVVNHFMHIAAMLKRSEIDIFHYAEGPNRLRVFLDAALHVVRPDGHMPVCGDGGSFSLFDEAGAYEIAYAEYGDPRYGWVIADTPRDSLEALLYGAEEVTSNPPERTSHVLPTSGHCVLRNADSSQSSAAKDSYVYVNFGTFGDWHGHPDALSIEYFAAGHPLLQCLGSAAGYHDRIHWEWYRPTLSHTTLTVDGEGQEWCRNGNDASKDLDTAGNVLDFAHHERLAIVTASHEKAYPNLRCCRHLALIDDLLVDCFDVSAEAAHTYDLAYHGTGSIESALPFEADTDPPTDEAWQYIVNLQVARPLEDWSVHMPSGGWPDGRFHRHGFGLRIWQKHAPDTVVRWGLSPRGKQPYGPSLIVRRRASNTRFLTLVEPTNAEQSDTGVTFGEHDYGFALTIERQSCRIHYAYALTGHAEEWSFDGIQGNARMLCVIVEDDSVAYVQGDGGAAEIRFKGKRLEMGASIQPS